MAVTAKFIADFQSFKTAVDQSVAKLKDFESEAHKVGPALNRMVDQFSGRKLIQEATLMARVLGDAGSIARLTGNELQVAGAKAAEASEKMKRMGVDVPPGLQRIADAAKQAADATKATGDAAKGAGGSMGLLVTGIGALAGAFTIAKVVGFASDLVSAAGALQDFHERTDISIAGLQRFKIIAEQSGSSLDAVATAVFQMGRRFAGDDKSAAKAVAELGLNFTQLRAMRPEDAFTTVGKALGALEDPMKRSQLGIAIFGRSVDELVPTLKHLGDETESYLTLSAQQVKAIDWLGDAFVRAKASIIPFTVAVIDNTFQISKAYNAWSSFLGKIDDAPKVIGAAKAALDAMNAGVAGRALQPVGGEELDRIQAQAVEQLNAALAAKVQRLAESKAAAEKAAKAAAQLATDLLKIQHVLPGVTGQFGRVDDSVIKLGGQIRELVKDLSALERHGWSTAGVMRQFADDLEDLGEHVDAATIKAYADEWAWVGPEIRGARTEAQTFGESLDDLAASMTQLAQVSGDSFGGILQDLAQLVVAWNMAEKAAKHYQAAQASGSKMGMATGAIGMAGAMWSATSHKSTAQNVIGGAMTGAAIGSVIPGIGTAAGAAVGALVGLARSIKKVGEEEKDARKEAALFAGELAKTATAAQMAEAGGEGWKLEVIQVRDAYLKAGLSADEASAAVARLWDATREGAAATAQAQAAIQSVIDFNIEVAAAIKSAGYVSRKDLEALADTAEAVYEGMLRDGTYSAEQLADAWEDSNRATQIALGDTAAIAAAGAEAAGFRTIAQLEQTARDARAMYLYIRDSGLFTAGEAERAWAEVFGSHEDLYGDAAETIEQSRAAFDAANTALSASALEAAAKTAAEQDQKLKEQMDTQTGDIKAQVKDVAASLETALGGIRPQAIRVPVIFDIPAFPGGSAVPMPQTSGRSGGGGTAVIEVDGRVLAEAAVPHLPGAIERHGLSRR